MAPQLIVTKGRALRGLLWWIAFASSSLPVPVSPRISTVEFDCAARDAMLSTRSSALEWPRMLSKPYFSSSAARRLRTSSSRFCAPWRG